MAKCVREGRPEPPRSQRREAPRERKKAVPAVVHERPSALQTRTSKLQAVRDCSSLQIARPLGINALVCDALVCKQTPLARNAKRRHQQKGLAICKLCIHEVPAFQLLFKLACSTAL